MADRSLTPLAKQLRRLVESASLAPLTDAELLGRFVAVGDQAAFEALVRRHGPAVLAACLQVLSDPADAEDAFQATFLTLARKAGSVRKPEKVGAWLFGAARRVALEARANARRRRDREAEARRRAAQVSPQPDLSWHEAAGALHEELDRLPDRFRLPLELCYLQGMSRDEAAEALGWSAGSVKGQLERGRDLLRKRLFRRGVTLGAGLLCALRGSAAAALLPPRLVKATVTAATTGPVPASVSALIEGVSVSMLSKLKLAFALVAVLGVLAGVAAHRTLPALVASPSADPALQAEGAAPTQAERPLSPAHCADAGPGEVNVSGRVLGPDDKPVKGASVSASAGADARGEKDTRVTTGDDGRFRLSVKKGWIDRGGLVVATAAGLGPAWAELGKLSGGEITLRLVKDDLAVEGRILDLEGKPIRGLTVDVGGVGRAAGGDVGAWVDRTVAWRKRNPYLDPVREEGLDFAPAEALGVPASATTDAQGRFRLSGFGRDRVVRLHIRGDAVEHARGWAVTRPGPREGWVAGPWPLYPASFDRLAAPCKPFSGTVRDKRTGKALAGITVGGFPGMSVRATTDEKGRFRLVGVAKRQQGYLLSAGGGPGRPYIDLSKEVGDTPDLAPITVDFELERGVEITGRLTEKAGGAPVVGRVAYLYGRHNPRLKDYPTLTTRPLVAVGDWGRVGPDGSFSVLGIPGPAALIVTARDEAAFPALRADKADGQLGRLGVIRYSTMPPIHAIVPVDASEDDPKSLRYDTALRRCTERPGTVLGPDGKPLPGAWAAGLSYRSPPRELETAKFTAEGLGPGRTHLLIFHHRERRLGGLEVARGEEETPLVVRLKPLGTLTGRVVGDGQPLAGKHVVAVASLGPDHDNLPIMRSGLTLNPESDPPSWAGLTDRRAPVGEDGRFRLEGLLPGAKYLLGVADGAGRAAPVRLLDVAPVEVEPGGAKDQNLGRLKFRPAAK